MPETDSCGHKTTHPCSTTLTSAVDGLLMADDVQSSYHVYNVKPHHW